MISDIHIVYLARTRGIYLDSGNHIDPEVLNVEDTGLSYTLPGNKKRYYLHFNSYGKTWAINLEELN